MGLFSGILSSFSKMFGQMSQMREENRERPERRRIQGRASKNSGSRRWRLGKFKVVANTKSEARARIKELSKSPIPPGTKIQLGWND